MNGSQQYNTRRFVMTAVRLAVATVLGVIGAASVVLAQDAGQSSGQPCSLAGINPAEHPRGVLHGCRRATFSISAM